jgi:hypothetical protein
MPSTRKGKPRAGDAGSRKNDQLAGSIKLSNGVNVRDFQARWLPVFFPNAAHAVAGLAGEVRP